MLFVHPLTTYTNMKLCADPVPKHGLYAEYLNEAISQLKPVK